MSACFVGIETVAAVVAEELWVEVVWVPVFAAATAIPGLPDAVTNPPRMLLAPVGGLNEATLGLDAGGVTTTVGVGDDVVTAGVVVVDATLTDGVDDDFSDETLTPDCVDGVDEAGATGAVDVVIGADKEAAVPIVGVATVEAADTPAVLEDCATPKALCLPASAACRLAAPANWAGV